MADVRVASLARRPEVGELGTVVRGVLLLRLALVALSVPAATTSATPSVLTLSVLVGVLSASLTPLLLWWRAEAFVLRHPLFLALDLGVAAAFLSVAGVAAPFVVATLATAFLGGLLYATPGAALSAGLLGLAYLGAVPSHSPGTAPPPVATIAVIVALYPLLAAAGARFRHLLEELHDARVAEGTAERAAAAAQERLRLARDLHDSVGKTLHGIALSARALQTEGSDGVERHADAIEVGARTAAAEARALIGALREAPPAALVPELRRLVTDWAAAHPVDVACDLDPAAETADGVRGEVLAVVAEALENVHRHAQASRVHVAVARDGDEVLIELRDDGVGFAPGRPHAALADGHYGLAGMRERVAGVGGDLQVDASPGRGTAVRLQVPAVEVEVTERGVRRDPHLGV